MPVLPEELIEELKSLRGLVATCVLNGSVDPEYASCREEMRVFNERRGLTQIEYRTFYCVLVESGRDEACQHALDCNYDYILQIDADAAPFPPNALLHLLARAFIEYPESDAFGAYAQLKQPPYLPTIDTGTGTWEEHYPGEGVLPVIRTGGHFLLTKASAFARLGPAPWFRTRLSPRLIDTMAELDSAARTRFSGKNPFTALPEWEALLEHARTGAGAGVSHVGEDSGFCDRLTAAGGRIYVDTDLVAGHVSRTHITPDMLRDALERRDSQIRARCGVFD